MDTTATAVVPVCPLQSFRTFASLLLQHPVLPQQPQAAAAAGAASTGSAPYPAFPRTPNTRLPFSGSCSNRQSDSCWTQPVSADCSPPPRMARSQAVITAWDEAIGRLVEAGVTGRILLANVGSPKGLSVSTRRSGPAGSLVPSSSLSKQNFQLHPGVAGSPKENKTSW